MGGFDTKYLDVPEDVLVTSMETHQRYFVVRDLDGRLKPNFISVRNGNAEHLENVVRGNEKVLVARLEDGEFFWREDQKLKIEDLVAKLATSLSMKRLALFQNIWHVLVSLRLHWLRKQV